MIFVVMSVCNEDDAKTGGDDIEAHFVFAFNAQAAIRPFDSFDALNLYQAEVDVYKGG